MKDAKNGYRCEKCGGTIYTIDRANNGVTPMFLVCRATEGCDGRSVSLGYNVDVYVEPTFEWYRPNDWELTGLDSEMFDHVRRGGLMIRAIQPKENSDAEHVEGEQAAEAAAGGTPDPAHEAADPAGNDRTG